jgi:asparagine N-glycosylation enzyme membrane subunit Stt3
MTPIEIIGNVKKQWAGLFLATIILFGFAIRFYHLTWQCLNVDELVTQGAAAQSSAWIITWSLYSDYNPPLYYLIAHWSGLLTGSWDTFAIRIPAVLFGVLAIPVIYLIGKELKNETLGLLIATMVSFMFPFYYYSQNARAYSLVMLAFCCYTWFFIKIYHGDARAHIWAGLGISAAVCFYSHYYSAVPVILMGLILFRKERNATISALVTTILLCIPEGLLFNMGQFATRTVPMIYNVYWLTPYQMSVYLLNELFCWTWIIIIPLMAYCLYRYRLSLLQILFGISAITLILLIPLTHFTGLSPRYALLVSPLFLIVALYPVSGWIDNQPSLIKKGILFTLAVFIFFLFNYGSLLSWMTFNVCPLMNR